MKYRISFQRAGAGIKTRVTAWKAVDRDACVMPVALVLPVMPVITNNSTCTTTEAQVLSHLQPDQPFQRSTERLVFLGETKPDHVLGKASAIKR